MDRIPPAQRQKIIAALREKGAMLPCPRCGNKKFSLLDGYLSQPISAGVGGIMIGGPAIPAIVVTCKQCGYLSQHALGPLGLLPKKPELEPEEKNGG